MVKRAGVFTGQASIPELKMIVNIELAALFQQSRSPGGARFVNE